MKIIKFYRPIEIYFATQMLAYGLILVMPHNALEGYIDESVPIVGNELYWGIALILVSGFLFYAIVQKRKVIKIVSLCMTSFVWSSIATMFLLSSIETGQVTTGVTYYITAIFAFWLSYRIGGQQDV